MSLLIGSHSKAPLPPPVHARHSRDGEGPNAPPYPAALSERPIREESGHHAAPLQKACVTRFVFGSKTTLTIKHLPSLIPGR